LIRQGDGRRHNIPKRPGAVTGERHEPGIGGAWGQGAQDTRRQLPLVMALQIFHRRRLRKHPQAIDGDHFPAVCQIHDGGRDSEKMALMGVHDVQGQADRHPSVDGIAAPP
jgi:hypothetical protein